jgi:hypothetical protein
MYIFKYPTPKYVRVTIYITDPCGELHSAIYFRMYIKQYLSTIRQDRDETEFEAFTYTIRRIYRQTTVAVIARNKLQLQWNNR